MLEEDNSVDEWFMKKRHSVAFIYCSLHGGVIAMYDLVRMLQGTMVGKTVTVPSDKIRIWSPKDFILMLIFRSCSDKLYLAGEKSAHVTHHRVLFSSF